MLGRYDEAEPLHKRALAIREKVFGPNHPEVAQTLNNLGVLYANEGRYAEAEPLYKRALEIRIASYGADHLTTAETRQNLATLYYAQGRYDEAAPLYEQALKVEEKALGSRSPLARDHDLQPRRARPDPGRIDDAISCTAGRSRSARRASARTTRRPRRA